MINIFLTQAQHNINEKIRLTKLANKTNNIKYQKIFLNNKTNPKAKLFIDNLKKKEDDEVTKIKNLLNPTEIINSISVKNNKNYSNSIQKIIYKNISTQIKDDPIYNYNNETDILNDKNTEQLINNFAQLISVKPNIILNLIKNVNICINENNMDDIVYPKSVLIFFKKNEKVILKFIENAKFDSNILKKLLEKDNKILNYSFNNDFEINIADLVIFFDNLNNPNIDENDELYNDDDNIHLYKKYLSKNVKKINNIYQYSYKNEKEVTGLGDFIRGCFYLLQFCEKYNLELEIFINDHPLKNYFEHFKKKPNLYNIISKNIDFFSHPNGIYYYDNNKVMYDYINVDNKIIKEINSTINYGGNIFIYLHNHPNEKKITQEHKNKIKELFKPTNMLMYEIENTMKKISITKNNYIVLQIRVEDNYTYENNKRLQFMIDTIQTITKKIDYDILLISNNNKIKSIIINEIPNLKIKTLFNEIGHVADKYSVEEQIKNTLIEFYMMSFASFIYSITCYDHGSGFSKWCSVTYDIPYVCYLLPK